MSIIRRNEEKPVVRKKLFGGEGEYSDNGRLVTLRPGDMSFVGDGEGHALKNTGSEDLEAIALILYV